MVGGWLVFLNPKGPSLLAQPQASALPPSPVIFSRTENLDPPITASRWRRACCGIAPCG